MGSKGTGSFTDYPGSDKKTLKKGRGGGGDAPPDRCDKAFSVKLEDVEHSDFYKRNGAAPPVGTTLHIAHQKRIVATARNVAVGNLPTKMNYLAGCMKAGFAYVGKVTSSKAIAGVASVTADFAPQ